MATITPTWTENQTISGFNNATLAAAASTSGDIDLDTSGYDLVSIQIKTIFGGSPDGDVLIEILSSPDSGTTDDTIPVSSINVEEETSGTKIISIDVSGKAYITVKATNNDSTDTINVAALYAGRKWSST